MMILDEIYCFYTMLVLSLLVIFIVNHGWEEGIMDRGGEFYFNLDGKGGENSLTL